MINSESCWSYFSRHQVSIGREDETCRAKRDHLVHRTRSGLAFHRRGRTTVIEVLFPNPAVCGSNAPLALNRKYECWIYFTNRQEGQRKVLEEANFKLQVNEVYIVHDLYTTNTMTLAPFSTPCWRSPRFASCHLATSLNRRNSAPVAVLGA
jgi:hypothetical protein